ANPRDGSRVQTGRDAMRAGPLLASILLHAGLFLAVLERAQSPARPPDGKVIELDVVPLAPPAIPAPGPRTGAPGIERPARRVATGERRRSVPAPPPHPPDRLTLEPGQKTASLLPGERLRPDLELHWRPGEGDSIQAEGAQAPSRKREFRLRGRVDLVGGV